MLIARPERTEAPDHFFTYIDQVKESDIVKAFSGQLESATALLLQVDEDRSLRRYEPGKWSLRELLNHITDTERIFSLRSLWFARGLEGALPSFDQDIAVAGAEAHRIPWARHVEEFRQVRLATISLFQNLPESAWSRSGIASGKSVSVRALAFIIAGHLEHHSRIMRERYLI